MASDKNLIRLLDQAKAKVFMGDNSAFLGSIMCSLNFIFDETIVPPTANVDGITLRIHPEFLMKIPYETRITVVLHELWHVGRLHNIRMGDRDPKIWNYACDIRINNDLEREGRSFLGVENCWKDPSYDANGILSEEQIYDLLIKNSIKIPITGTWGNQGGGGDLLAPPKGTGTKNEILGTVTRAIQQAQISKQAGNLPGDIQEILNQFLNPVVPWTTVLMEFFNQVSKEDYSWKKPNRRYSDMYLPSIGAEEGTLDHLAYFLDVSGSITTEQARRFSSEVKYIQEVLNPGKLTVIQFDWVIKSIKEFHQDEPFDKIEITGRGGTSLHQVHDWLEKHQPTAAVVFSDLEVDPMEPLNPYIPIVWAYIGIEQMEVPFGKLIHVHI